MRVLSLTLGLLVTMTILTTATTLGTGISRGEPPNATDHGVAEQTFYTLWSGDDDRANSSAIRSENESSKGLHILTASTDIPLDSPPAAVEVWNRGDIGDYPQTDATTSIAPSEAPVHDGRLVKDAYVSIFAIQPSTRANLSPDDHPLYVAPDGEVLGTVDFRVEPLSNDTSGPHYEYNRFLKHEVTEIRLLVDEEVEARSNGTHTPSLAYDALDGYPGREHTLTLEADINVTVERHTAVYRSDCVVDNTSKTCDQWWENQTVVDIESITVRDSINVSVYDLEISGFRTRYPDGDLGLVTYKSVPWLGHSLPGGSVRGVWRFYTARDAGWDTLVKRTDDGETTLRSPTQPLQVYAYPFQPGPTPSSRARITLLEIYGVETKPPTLPSEINLDVMDAPYMASFGIASRTRAVDQNISTVTAFGLVRGVTTEAELTSFSQTTIHPSNLTLSLLDTTPETVTVTATLRDAETGAPIDTSAREGYVILGGQRANTIADGTVTRTFPRSVGNIAARYEPGRWWYAQPGYTADTDAVFVADGTLQVLESLYRFSIPVGLFLLAVFFIDRITGWPLWPPWRDL